MRKVLDLGELHKQLRQTEEHEPHNRRISDILPSCVKTRAFL